MENTDSEKISNLVHEYFEQHNKEMYLFQSRFDIVWL